MYRTVPIIQTFDVRLIDRFYRCSFYDIDITLHGDTEGWSCFYIARGFRLCG